VTRSKTKIKPCLVICATALILLPSTIISARIGTWGDPSPTDRGGPLKMPDAFPGPGIEANQAVAEQIISPTRSAIEIAGGHFDGDIYVTELFVAAQGSPRAGISGVLPGTLLPRFVSNFPGRGMVRNVQMRWPVRTSYPRM